MADNLIVHAIEAGDWIDRAAAPLAEPVRDFLDRSPVIDGAVSGAWLGHPLHPVITDVPVGAWFAGQVLDAIDVFGNGRKLRAGADAVHAVGLAGALLAAVAGVADFSRTSAERRRTGFVHGVANLLVAGLYGASLWARARGRRGAGVALSSAGFGVLVFSSWLGGELTYRLGTRVERSEAQEEQAGQAGSGALEDARPTDPGVLPGAF